VGLTKRHNRFHFKLLYSNAFRAPGIENINLQDSAGISPERTRVTELELGYQLNKKSIVTVNLFDIATTDAIVYYFDDSLETDAYHNAGATGSRGAELEYKLKDRWGYLNLNYAFYTSAGIPNVPDYEVPGRSDVLLAFPAHRLNLNVGYSVTRKFSVAATASLRTERYAYTSIDTVGTAVVSRLPPNFQLNLFLRYQDLFVNGLTVGIGVYDVFDQGIQYIQPYNSYHAPLPGTGTELMVKLSYHFTRKSS
jgi:outer membrane receptor for ferrienterochelin and colicin